MFCQIPKYEKRKTFSQWILKVSVLQTNLLKRILSSAILQSIVSIHVQVCVAVPTLLRSGAHQECPWRDTKTNCVGVLVQRSRLWKEKKNSWAVVIYKVIFRWILESQHVQLSVSLPVWQVCRSQLPTETVSFKLTFKASCSAVIWTEKFSASTTVTHSHYSPSTEWHHTHR